MGTSVPTMLQTLLSNDWASQGLMSTEQGRCHSTSLGQLDFLMHFLRPALGDEGQMPSWKISLGYDCWQSVEKTKGRKASTGPGTRRFWVLLPILLSPSCCDLGNITSHFWHKMRGLHWREVGGVVISMSFTARPSRCESHLWHSPVLWSWTRHVISPNLRVLRSKVRIIIVPASWSYCKNWMGSQYV